MHTHGDRKESGKKSNGKDITTFARGKKTTEKS